MESAFAQAGKAYIEENGVVTKLQDGIMGAMDAETTDFHGFLTSFFEKRANIPVIDRLQATKTLSAHGTWVTDIEVFVCSLLKIVSAGHFTVPYEIDLDPEVSDSLADVEIEDLEGIDSILSQFDEALSKACSQALFCAAARLLSDDPFLYFSKFVKESFSSNKMRTPKPLFPIITGGTNFDGIMITMKDDIPFHEMVRIAFEIQRVLNCKEQPTLQEALSSTESSIKAAGFNYQTVMIGVQCASSRLFNETTKAYLFDGSKTTDEMVSYWKSLCQSHPIVYLENPFLPSDVESFAKLGGEFNEKITIATTDCPKSQSELLLMHQSVGLLLDPINFGRMYQTINLIREVSTSHRKLIMDCTDVEDSSVFTTDLSVAAGALYAKIGPLTSGENIEKCNQFIRIQERLSKIDSV